MRVRNELSVESIKKLAYPNAQCRMRNAEFIITIKNYLGSGLAILQKNLNK